MAVQHNEGMWHSYKILSIWFWPFFGPFKAFWELAWAKLGQKQHEIAETIRLSTPVGFRTNSEIHIILDHFLTHR